MPKMATRQNPETETSRHRYAADLARWDNEGGAPAPLASEAVSEASQDTRSSLDHGNDATLGRRQRVMAGRYERHTTLIKRPDVATKEDSRRWRRPFARYAPDGWWSRWSLQTRAIAHPSFVPMRARSAAMAGPTAWTTVTADQPIRSARSRKSSVVRSAMPHQHWPSR